MIKGLSFRIEQSANSSLLWQIFMGTDIEKYDWYNIENQTEVWFNFHGDNFFTANYYDGRSFSQHIQHSHYIIFLKLQAYDSNGKFFNIHTYEEFQNSDCMILCLINDSEFVEIFTKNDLLAQSLFKNAQSHSYAELQYITDENNKRSKMDVI